MGALDRFFISGKEEQPEQETSQQKEYKDIKSDEQKGALESWFEGDYSEQEEDNTYEEEFEIEMLEADEQGELPEQEEKPKSKFGFFKKNKQSEQEEDDYYYVEDEEDDYEEEKDDMKQEGFIAKLVSLFVTDKESSDIADIDNEVDEDKPEDYKTYFERQKNQKILPKVSAVPQEESNVEEVATEDVEVAVENIEDDSELIIEDYTEHTPSEQNDVANEQHNEDDTKQSFIKKLKTKVSDIANYGLKEDDELFEEDNKQKGFKNWFKKEEQTNNSSSNVNISEELQNIEDPNFANTELEKQNIKETLQQFGIDATDIKEVDLFEDNTDRRTHPTLASVKIKRIIQEQSIDNLATDLVFEDGKESLQREIVANEEVTTENVETTPHISKNIDEINRLNEDFNKLERKEDKISYNSDNVSKENNEKVTDALNKIKEVDDKNKLDYPAFDIDIEEVNSDKERREKLKYASVDEVLEGKDALIENDVDKVAKVLVVDRTAKQPEEIKQFQENIEKEPLLQQVNEDEKGQTELDKLIMTTATQEKQVETTETELDKLEKNLEIIKEENKAKLGQNLEEEISIEQVAKDNEPSYPTYDDIKKEQEEPKNILDGYSDYNLDLEEIEELTTLNKIESASENTSIEALTKTLNIESLPRKEHENDIDKFVEEKLYTPTKRVQIFRVENNKAKQEREREKQLAENTEEKESEVGIEYVEKLYSEEVTEKHVDRRGTMSFGEYVTVDRGYRPVSRDTIESNQRKLDEIFSKYSSNATPKKNTTEYVERKITSSSSNKPVGKYKPTPMYSPVYGSATPPAPKKVVTSITKTKDVKKKTEVTENPKGRVKRAPVKKKDIDTSDLFKEIASQEEATWNIELNSRVPKTRGRKKKETNE